MPITSRRALLPPDETSGNYRNGGVATTRSEGSSRSWRSFAFFSSPEPGNARVAAYIMEEELRLTQQDYPMTAGAIDPECSKGDTAVALAQGDFASSEEMSCEMIGDFHDSPTIKYETEPDGVLVQEEPPISAIIARSTDPMVKREHTSWKIRKTDVIGTRRRADECIVKEEKRPRKGEKMEKMAYKKTCEKDEEESVGWEESVDR